MELCSEDHDEVCYEGSTCPVCEAIEKYKGAAADGEKVLEAQAAALSGALDDIKTFMEAVTPVLNEELLVKLNRFTEVIDDISTELTSIDLTEAA